MLSLIALSLLGIAEAAAKPSVTVVTITSTIPPDYFQTTPELLPLSTATGPPPFLAQTNPAPFPSVSYVPPHPLETQEPIQGRPANGNIFQNMGQLSPYSPGPGFGVDEHPIPQGSQITWVNMLSRHGSRYPTAPIALAAAIKNATSARFSGALSFINTWGNPLQQGNNILSPWGRQELYDSGVLHNYLYGHLYNGTYKLLARTTTQDRMLKSAENFMAGFFGLEWTNNATLEVILDTAPFNNSLSGYLACTNNNNFRTSGGVNASTAWTAVYTSAALARFQKATTGFNWTSTYVFQAQQLCAYETVVVGYSQWCSLFNYQEWLDFEQAADINFAGVYGFQSPTGRAVGVGYAQEVLARINHHYLTTATASDNITLDSMPETFPLYQPLNFDFSHDVNIYSVLTAGFGLTQFNHLISNSTYDPNRTAIVSQIAPFGARIDIELIEAPQPISPYRPAGASQYTSGSKTTYIHFIVNQRTVPLGKSFPSCGQRADGWCELQTFLKTQQGSLQKANYDYACHGNYTPPAYGSINNGAIASPK